MRVVRPTIAGVHENRFALRGHEERRCAALNIDPVDIQRVLLSLRIESKAAQHEADAQV